MTRVLMFGWEFPPYSSGGLGTACYGLTKSLSKKGVDIAFIVPTKSEKAKYVKLVSAGDFPAERIRIRKISSPITPYITSEQYQCCKEIINKGDPAKSVYGNNLMEEVERYAARAAAIAREEPHDVIHAHDWLTYKAGISAKKISGKPLVVHMHATEFDRSGGNGVNQYVYDIEREGLHKADKIIAVSNFTKNKVIEHYGVSPDKIEVVHNAVEFTDVPQRQMIPKDDKIVLFLGRVTLQKGPDYFLYTAKRVLEHYPNVKFVMAGKGDMLGKMIEKSAELGISDKVLFTGYIADKDLDRAYRMADLYVMPSVSEPFGITPLESMRNGTPVMISKQSGVSEVISHCLKVDFWDIDEMANKMISVLHHAPLHECLKENGTDEVMRFSWDNPADKCIRIYEGLR